MKLNDLKKKRILILGFGKEGLDTLNFLRKLFPNKITGVGDRNEKINTKITKDKKIRWYLGANYLKALEYYDLVIKSPGIPIHLPEIEKAYKEGKITSQTEIFFDNCPGKIIGITGTKGKSTTTALIYAVLKEGSIKAHLVGNIGKPVLSLLLSATKNDFYVYELSSHQLYNLKRSPQVAVLLNIYQEHLDYYKNFNEYKNAKTNIIRYQKKDDFLIYNAKDKTISQIAKKAKAKKIPINGKYYKLDMAAAKIVGKIFKIPAVEIKRSIRDFKFLAHRLEYVGEFKGIKFYNDALSTIPEATIYALDFLGDSVQTLFLGGFDRGLKFDKLAKKVLESKVKNLILFPTTGSKIWKEISKQNKGKKAFNIYFADNMKDAVRWAFKNTDRGKICLLSCASSSFSIFRDYKQKGNLFKKYVRKFGKHGKIQ